MRKQCARCGTWFENYIFSNKKTKPTISKSKYCSKCKPLIKLMPSFEFKVKDKKGKIWVKTVKARDYNSARNKVQKWMELHLKGR